MKRTRTKHGQSGLFRAIAHFTDSRQFLDCQGKEMARLRGFEPPTFGSGGEL